MFIPDTRLVMMLETLLQNEITNWAIAIGAGIGTLFSILAGMKAKDRRTENNLELAHEILKKLQLMHEDISRLVQDMPNVQLIKRDVNTLDEHLDDLAKTIAVMMDTTGRTYDKTDRIESVVNLLKELERRKNING